jgi:hypothetical protein
MKAHAPSFERLEQATTIIARRAQYPGKREIVAECLDDVEDRWRRGQLTLEQRFRLSAILIRGTASRPWDRPLATGL